MNYSSGGTNPGTMGYNAYGAGMGYNAVPIGGVAPVYPQSYVAPPLGVPGAVPVVPGAVPVAPGAVPIVPSTVPPVYPAGYVAPVGAYPATYVPGVPTAYGRPI